jgi:hypothetical protein
MDWDLTLGFFLGGVKGGWFSFGHLKFMMTIQNPNEHTELQLKV